VNALLLALVFITNERAGTISVIDAGTNRVVATVPVGTRVRGMVVSPDQKRLYVAVSHFKGKPNRVPDQVAVIDTATLKIVKHIPAGTDPEGIAITPDGRKVAVSNEDAGTASIVDTRSGKTVAALVVGTEPEGVAISGKTIFVTGETSNTVSVIERLEVVANILVDARPRYAIFTPDGRYAYVSAEIGGSISLIDVAARRVVKRLKLAPVEHPVGMILDGNVLYAATGRGNGVAVIDTTTFRILRRIAVGQRPWHLAISGRKLYVANGLSNTVSVIDLATDKVVATIPVGDGPWGVAVVSGLQRTHP
jgi:PQQ-dependent catabolism-associated beta-propeller protein